jgi:O-antigen ligase
MAVHKELSLARFTPINKPILNYVFVCLIATFLGALRGFVNLNISVFYLIKYFEYFLLFFMVTNIVRTDEQVKIFVFSILCVAFLISLYACFQHFRGVERVTAPFEGKAGEANTLAGYLILIISFTLGLLMNLRERRLKVLLFISLMVSVPAFLFTLSRSGWIAFVPAFITIIILSRRGRPALIIAAILVGLAAQQILPKFFYKRIDETFQTGKSYELMGKRVKLEDSAGARIVVFNIAVDKLKKEPVFGYGVGSSLRVLDNQYARILIEVGLLGLILFIWLMRSIFINALRNLNKLREDNFSRGLIVGFIAGLVGLLVHSVGAESFIIIRIMEPFWFMAAIVMRLPEIYGQEAVQV